MKKEDLIKELTHSTEDSFAIFSKGYLEHFEMDQEIFAVLLPKLMKESEDLVFINDTIVDAPQLVSDEIVNGFRGKSQEFYDVVQELCLDEVEDLPYIAKCIRILQDNSSPNFASRVKAELDKGYSFKESQIDGSLVIKDPEGDIIFSSPFTSMKQILQEIGIDTEHAQYGLFYFGLFPKDELYTHRLAYAFRSYFNL